MPRNNKSKRNGASTAPRRRPPTAPLRRPVVVQSRPRARTVLAARPRAPRSRPSNGGSQVQRVNSPSQGSNLASSIGQGIGGIVTKGLNAGWNWITGSGAYTVKKNSMASGRPPLFAARMGGDGTLEFAHSEFLQDVKGSLDFTLQSFLINPGLFETFPYLANLASHFEQYEMLGLVFQYRSTSAVALNSTNTALGVVIMSTEYDVLDVNFQSKQQMEAYMFTTSSSPAMTMTHPVECAPRMNVLSDQYIRSAAYPTGADPRFYDLGNFQIATQGMQAVATIGELWVSYHVRLMKPKLPTPLGEHLRGAHATELPSNSCTTASPFGTKNDTDNQDRIHPGSNLPMTIDNTSFTLQLVGTYLVVIRSQAAQTITTVGGIATGANLALKLFWANNSEGGVDLFQSLAGESVSINVITVNKPGTGGDNLVIYTGPTGMTSGTFDLVIQQISNGLEGQDRNSDTKRANFLDDLVNRLERLEGLGGVAKQLRNGSLTDEDWQCDPNTSSSSSSSLKKPGVLPSLHKTLAIKETSLSDSVVDLITSKLRK